jgi:hypothetical protein
MCRGYYEEEDKRSFPEKMGFVNRSYCRPLSWTVKKKSPAERPIGAELLLHAGRIYAILYYEKSEGGTVL